MQLIDTHAHLNFKAFNKDRDRVIKRCLDNNVWLINASSTFNTSKMAVEIAEKYGQGVYASVGLHPIHVKDEEFVGIRYRQLAQSKKVVAIGETGLDYMYGVKDLQKKVFLEHLGLAQVLGLPIIFHCRKAHNDLLEILKFQVSRFRFQGVVHCFSGRWGQAKQYLDMGLYLGFNGIIFKLDLDEVIKKTPLDRMLIETDCPYLTPPLARHSPQGEGGRNEPIFVKYTAQRIAEIRGESFEKIAEITAQNARKLFDI